MLPPKFAFSVLAFSVLAKSILGWVEVIAESSSTGSVEESGKTGELEVK